jgi:hypothetical protein
MAAVITPSLGAAELHSAVTIPKPEEINSINDFIIHQARSIPDTPLIAYPASELGAADFENYSARDLDTFADEAAKSLASQGLVPRVNKDKAIIFVKDYV